jgi:hypothetical protein
MADRANKTQMEELHSLTCQFLTDMLKARGYADPKTGEWTPLPASYLTAAIKFLSDNDIKGMPVEGSPLSNLLKSLNFDDIAKDIEASATLN